MSAKREKWRHKNEEFITHDDISIWNCICEDKEDIKENQNEEQYD